MTVGAQCLTNGVRGHWPLDGDASDISGCNLNGSVIGATATTDYLGNASGALSFDGISDVISLGVNSLLRPALPVTVFMRIKHDCPATGNCWLFENDIHPTNYYGISFNLLDDGSGMYAQLGDGGSPSAGNRRSASVTSNISANEWHDVALVVNGLTDFRFYVDGVRLDQASVEPAGTGNFLVYSLIYGAQLGNDSGIFNAPYKGDMDEVRFWGRALLDSEIQALSDADNDGVADVLEVANGSDPQTPDVIFFSSTFHSAWQAEVGVSLVNSFDTTAANVALANEVASPPVADADIGTSVLTFSAANTGLCGDVTLTSTQSGATFSFEEAGFFTPRSLSPGRDGVYEHDDIAIDLPGSAYYAFAVELLNNTSEPGERLLVYGTGGLIGSFDLSLLPNNQSFLGVVADQPITQVQIDESAGPDDIVIRDLRLVCVNEDADADGVNNLAERQQGLNPEQSDSDSDGLSDGDEINTHSTDPLDFDSDDDGVNDGDEVNLHSTNPLSNDTDSDGLLDAFEISNGFNPLVGGEQNVDTDLDGLTNLQEQSAGTDPNNGDSDSDGFLDGDEVNLGTDPLSADENPLAEFVLAPSGLDDDDFGQSVAINGDIAVVGAPLNDVGGLSAGAVYSYLYSGSSWVLNQTLYPSGAGGAFGESVAISGDTLIVGSPWDDTVGTNTGAAYVYQRDAGNNWIWSIKLLPTTPVTFEQFGESVAIDGDVAAVGAPYFDNGTNPGSAYIFQRSGGSWNVGTRIVEQGSFNGDRFGASVSVEGNTVMLGRHREFGGAVYVYTGSGLDWTFRTKLTAIDAADNDDFGFSIALSDGVAAIGAPRDDDLGENSGALYLFEGAGSNWSQVQKYTSTNAASSRFGDAVASDGNLILVSSEDGNSENYVEVFLRSGSGWLRDLVAISLLGSDRDFGKSLAVNGVNALAGTPNKFGSGTATESAYFLSLDKDGDGLSSAFEIGYGYDDLVAGENVLDLDSDGLDNLGEHGASSSPVIQDTDGDGYDDLSEVTAGSLPLQPGSNPAFIRFEASSSEFNSKLGSSVAIEGEIAVVGAPAPVVGSTDLGAIYIFEFSSGAWNKTAEFFSPATNPEKDLFGATVAISNGTIMVAAPHGFYSGIVTAIPGAVYVYEKSGATWGLVQTLAATDASVYDYFGSGLSIVGDTAFIGAAGNDQSGSNSGGGALYQFERTAGTWAQTAKLLPASPLVHSGFGSEVAFDGATLLVSARDNVTDQGEVFVFEDVAGSWTEQQVLTPANGVGFDSFGSALDLDGQTLLAGAPGFANGSDSGAAYVFSKNGATW
ncbi:MAG: LamG-like jellyroll fold domain-containing protein, partial [Pseudomonadales bacterium]